MPGHHVHLSDPLVVVVHCRYLLGLHMWDPHVNVHMGDCAELCAQTYQITREDMDDHALLTFQRAQAAAPYTQKELVPVQLPASKSEPTGRVLDHDESLGKINEQKLRGLKPHFKKVTRILSGHMMQR